MTMKRWSIYRANLDPVIGSEQGKSRPVLVISENGTQIFGEFTLFDQIIENVLHRERYLFRIDFNNRDNPILKIFDNLPII